MKLKAGLTVFAMVAGGACFAEDSLGSVIIRDGTNEPISVGCQKIEDLWSYDLDISQARRAYLEDGVPLDPALLEELEAADCLIVTKGSWGNLHKDSDGRFYVYLQLANYLDGTSDIALGNYYFREYAYRWDLDTIVDLDEFR